VEVDGARAPLEWSIVGHRHCQGGGHRFDRRDVRTDRQRLWAV